MKNKQRTEIDWFGSPPAMAADELIVAASDSVMTYYAAVPQSIHDSLCPSMALGSIAREFCLPCDFSDDDDNPETGGSTMSMGSITTYASPADALADDEIDCYAFWLDTPGLEIPKPA